jgi:hypothetical protein
MPKVTPQCQLASTDGFEKPKNAKYTCKCGETFDGLKAWREHMVQRSLLRKRKPMTRDPFMRMHSATDVAAVFDSFGVASACEPIERPM